MPKSPRPETRQRLLDVATEVFARQGFRNARVRDICRRAKANVAAINYHFGDKAGLYDEVLHYAFFSLTGDDPTDWQVDENADAEAHLAAFIGAILGQLLGREKSVLFAKLVAREMMEPTHALERVVEEGIRPQVDALFGLISSILGGSPSPVLVRRCVSSIIGQCLFYHFARPAILSLPLEKELGPETVGPLANHVARFSLAALHGMADEERRK